MTDTKRRLRPKGSGGVRNRGTERQPRWFGFYSLTIDGKRRQVSRGPFPRKADAEQWLRDELTKAREGRATLPTKLTVGQLGDEWLAARRHGMRPNVFAEYERIVQHRIKPTVGHVKARELRPTHVAGMLDQLRQPGANRRGRKIDRYGNPTKSDKGLSETSLQHTLGVLSSALEWAVRRGDLSRNVARDVDRPRREDTEMKIWTADELARFLDHVTGDRLAPLFRLAAMTGARRSELLGLRWTDVDLDAATLSIRRARTRVGYTMHESARTKTKAGTRVVDLDPQTVAALKAWAKAQKAERLRWGPAWTDSGYVFTAEDGQPVHADHLAGRFGRLVKAAGVPAIRFHDLRHTHASLLLAAGVPVLDVSRRIGHASAAMTLNVYGHVVPGQGQKAAATFADLVEGSG